MRNIERRMLEAIERREPFKLDNTYVSAPDPDDGAQVVKLFGHIIALVRPHSIVFSLAGWDTATTRSRINAILRRLLGGPPYAGVFKRGGQTYFADDITDNGRAIDSYEWIEVKR